MNAKLLVLAERRKQLLEKSAQQRVTLSQAAEPWRVALARADAGLAAVRYLKSHPVWLAGAGGLLITMLGPSRIWRWLGRGWVGLQMLSRLRTR